MLTEKNMLCAWHYMCGIKGCEMVPLLVLVRQLEKITVKKMQAKVVKCSKTNLGSLDPPPPLGHLCDFSNNG